ncbi:diacylglycerol kinase [Motiliproteus sp. SC1-56]|uniref:diacylglycerol kinase n=1 Tax=Motiliproteus sp. SC1-56 TaxID=2799565 RepID=UPI001A8FA845|nr:diacylglycerol kinase [Motiliproteus sp. SC1-56]
MAKPGLTGLSRLTRATGYSLQGLRACWRHEAAFRQEVVAVLLLAPLAFAVGDTLAQVALLLASLGLLLVVELLNSALEALVDRVGEEYHELSGRAKDMGSAAVLLTLLTVVVVWALVLVENWLLPVLS